MVFLPAGEWSTAVERLGAAAFGGAVIGLNRNLHHKPAGVRTHALVALGSAMYVYTSLGGAPLLENGGPALRTVQGIVTGIGFLGAGVILHPSGEKKDRIQGLTTASAIWLAAAVGVACGLGEYVPVIVALGLALIILIVGGPLEDRLRKMLKPRVVVAEAPGPPSPPQIIK